MFCAFYGLDRVEIVGFTPDPDGNELVMIEFSDGSIMTVPATELSRPHYQEEEV